MKQFDLETQVTPDASGRLCGVVSGAWNIAGNPNGGYLLALCVSALRKVTGAHVDPLSATAHFLRPGLPGKPCRVETQLIRSGRTLTTARATLIQDEEPRLEVIAALGSLHADTSARLTIPMPELPPPESCIARTGNERVSLPLLDQLDLRIHPDEARIGLAGRAQVTGWVRFRDDRPPDTHSCLLFTDAFPPPLFGLLGAVAWVPTIELTVHVRRRPAPGWMVGQFRTLDMIDGRVIEDGMLWDSNGDLVAQSRQLALFRQT